MERNIKNNSREANKLFSQLAVDKKKSVMALCLIGVMVFMWARMFGGKTPESAGAALIAEAVAKSELGSGVKISFIELPKVISRNDALTRDFFVIDGGNLNRSAAEFVLGDGGEEIAMLVVGKLKLEAIVVGTSPQAFINDKFLSVGDKLDISDGDNTYECEVIEIEEDKAVIRCGEAEITLKLTDI